MTPELKQFKERLPEYLIIGHIYVMILECGAHIAFRVEGAAEEGLLIQPYNWYRKQISGDRMAVPVSGRVALTKHGVCFKFD